MEGVMALYEELLKKIEKKRREISDLEARAKVANLHLQVLEESDPEFNFLVAHCIETGTTVTAEDPTVLRSLIKEALQLHISLAAEQGNPEAIYYRQAAPDVWVRYNAARALDPGENITLQINVPGAQRRGVTSELSIVRGLRQKSA